MTCLRLVSLLLLFLPITLPALPHDSTHQVGFTYQKEGIIFPSGLTLRWYRASSQCQLMALPTQPGESQRILWQNVYDNVDLIISTSINQSFLTYEWVVYPGGSPAEIDLYTSPPLMAAHGITASFPSTPYDDMEEPEAWQDQGGITDKACGVKFMCEGAHLRLDVGSYESNKVLTIRWIQVVDE